MIRATGEYIRAARVGLLQKVQQPRHSLRIQAAMGLRCGGALRNFLMHRGQGGFSLFVVKPEGARRDRLQGRSGASGRREGPPFPRRETESGQMRRAVIIEWTNGMRGGGKHDGLLLV